LCKLAMHKAGAAKLMTEELSALMNMAGELLAVAAQREARQIDEKLFLEMTAHPLRPKPRCKNLFLAIGTCSLPTSLVIHLHAKQRSR
jgi:hypothetical protein